MINPIRTVSAANARRGSDAVATPAAAPARTLRRLHPCFFIGRSS
jgi:hypothetical protein